MRLETGTRVGVFEVLELLGAGGMGEVYRARDTKLGREVAVKIVPAQSPERLQRFQREAHLLASLNHTNIAAIHGLENHDDVPFLVLELVPGDTLADRLQGGRIPTAEALALALQIAEALEAAHEKGVIHRDLKPANVKVTPEGRVKVLDFGLAKAFVEDPASPELSNSPTLSAAATRDGVILGTAAYMSPEQARGKSVDKRTDVFSFGVVLFEMLTGRRLFQGEEVSDVLASVLKNEPDWAALPGDTPSRVRDVLRRCLEKDPRKRTRDIGDVRLEIEEAVSHPESVSSRESAPNRPTWPLVTAFALASSLVTGGLVWNLKPNPPGNVARLSINLPPGEHFFYTGRHVLALSPSGTHLVYGASGRLNLRSLDRLDPVPLRGTEESRSPVFTPMAMKKVSVTGGIPITLCAAENPLGTSWGPDGILFGQGARGIWRVSPDGGEPEVLVAVEATQAAHGPQILPGGRHVLFTLRSGTEWDEADLVVQALDTGERKTLLRGGSDGRFVSSGHLVYANGTTLFAVPFDPTTLETRGAPAPVVEGVLRSTLGTTGDAHFSVSANGALAYIPGRGDERASFVLVDRNGRSESVVEERGYLGNPRFSPDGSKIAGLLTDGGRRDAWILDLARGTFARLHEGNLGVGLAWSPDGEWVALSSERSGTGLDVLLSPPPRASRRALPMRVRDPQRTHERRRLRTEKLPPWHGLRSPDIWRGGSISSTRPCSLFQRRMECLRRMGACALSRPSQRRGAVSPSRPPLAEETSTQQRRAHRSLVVVDQERFQHRRFRPHPCGREKNSRTRRSLLLRSPVSLSRMQWSSGSSHVLYQPKPSHHHPSELFPRLEKIDVLEFLARVITQIPEPKRHLLFYYGHYANVVRGRRLKTRQPPDEVVSSLNAQREDEPTISPDQKQALRRRWANLIRRVLELDPLLCPCGGTLRVVAFLTEPRVIRKILEHLKKTANGDRAPPRETFPSP